MNPNSASEINGHAAENSTEQNDQQRSGQPEPDSTTSGYPDELEELIIRSLRGGNSNGSGEHSAATSNAQEVEALLSQLENLDDINRLIDAAEGGADHDYELPRSLIVTNLDIRIFTESSAERAQFEETFREVDQTATFLYFKSFRRARVDFAMSLGATKARILCNQRRIGDETINCYYAEVCDMVSNMLLRPPALEKQFLISPPASPPEGWHPVEEAQPVLNFDLQRALANLLPGTTHELHAATEDQPGIVVHICPDTTTDSGHLAPELVVAGPGEDMSGDDSEDSLSDDANWKPIGFGSAVPVVSRKLPQTACPPSMSSAAAARNAN